MEKITINANGLTKVDKVELLKLLRKMRRRSGISYIVQFCKEKPQPIQKKNGLRKILQQIRTHMRSVKRSFL